MLPARSTANATSGVVSMVELTVNRKCTVAVAELAATTCGGGFALSSQSVFWGQGPGGAILAAPLDGIPDGGAPTALVTGLSRPPVLAADDVNVYWSDDRLHQSSAAGGAPIDLASTFAAWIATRAGYVLWVDYSQVYRVPIGGVPDGGAPAVLASVLNSSGLALDDTAAYVGTNTGTFKRVDLATGAVTLLYSQLPPVWAMAMDAKYFYWVGNGKVLAVPKVPDGSPPLVLAAGVNGAATLAISPDAVFWPDAKGTLYRVTKP